MMRNSLKRKPRVSGLSALLEDPRVRRIEREGQIWYSAQDLVAALSESEHAAEFWADLKAREPRLGNLVERLEMPEASGNIVEMLPLDGVLRLVQSVPSQQAERIKAWLASAARDHLEELENPELTWVRLQKQYDQRGYSNIWVQKRLRGMAARQELVREWAWRGITDSEQYRELTNAIMEQAFGMDVSTYRQYKGLRRAADNLRDHMTDLELTLTMLGETAAVTLHRDHNSQGFEQLQADVRDAGEIAKTAREAIEQRGGRPVVSRWPGQQRAA
jgi:DNA-damage-inducible protein D